MELLKKSKELIFPLAYMLGTTGLMGLTLSPVTASATSKDPITSGLSNAGVSGGGELSVTDDLNGAIILLVALAAIWIIACIIFAAMKISGAQGNPQKRVEGIVGLAFAGLGAWVIFNAYNIYGWFSNIGGGAGA